MRNIRDRISIELVPSSPSNVALVRITRDKKVARLNALDLEAFLAIQECFSTVLPSEFPDVRSVVMMGEGRAFCAGIDLSDPGVQQNLFPRESECPSAARLKLLDFIRSLQAAFTALEQYPWPVITAAHGVVIGGGVDLICASDVRLCSADASFCVKEVDVGIVADLGTLQRLPCIVGHGRAAEWALTARVVPSAEALSSGLVSEVLPDREALESRALQLASTLARKPPLALRGTKRFLLLSRDQQSVQEGLERIATYNMGVLASNELRDKLQEFARGSSRSKGASAAAGSGSGAGRAPSAAGPRSKL